MTTIAQRLQASMRKSPYFGKDLIKAAKASQFIGEGSRNSSTQAYAIAVGDLANTGRYTSTDVVFVSAEGARQGRFNPIGTAGPCGAYRNLNLAIEQRARFIIDPPAHRTRPYNDGERQIAGYLVSRGYAEVEPGVFAPTPGR